MRFVRNITHPDDPRALARIECRTDQTPAEALSQRRRWLAGKSLGPPQPPVPGLTVEWMESNGYVGVYAIEEPRAAAA